MVALIGRKSVVGVVSWVLGIVNVFVLIGMIATLLGLVTSLVVPGFPGSLAGGAETSNVSFDYDGAVPLPFILLSALAACVLTWVTLHTLRRVFRAVNEGAAFDSRNVGRLRVIGASLAGLQVSSIALEVMRANTVDLNLGAWLSVLIVFALAEVFRQGAVMRDDYEATV